METLAHTYSGEYWPLIVSISASALLAAVVLRSKIRKRKKNRTEIIPGVPPVPNRHWLFGHMFYPEGGDQLAKQKAWCIDYADPTTGLCTFYMIRYPVLGVSKPEHAQKVLRTNTYKMSLPLFKRLGEMTFGRNNVATINGREWKIHRAPVTRALQSEKALRAAQRHILRVGETLADSVVRRIDSEGNDDDTTTLKIVPTMKMATIDIFGAAALGKDLGCCKTLEPSDIASAFDFLGTDLRRRMRSPFSPATHALWIPTEANKTFQQKSNILRDFLRETILTHLNRSENDLVVEKVDDGGVYDKEDAKDNLLSQMLNFNSSNNVDDKGSVDIDAVVDSMIVLLFAGYDTTANALSFALHEVANNPVVEKHCVAEATNVLAELEDKLNQKGSSQEAKLDILSRLPYCHAVLQEALRLHPPAGSTGRTIEKDLELDGITIPKGTTIVIPIYHIQRDANNFARPTEFLPERWVSQTKDGLWEERQGNNDYDGDIDETKRDGLPPVANREAFLPFSSGARNCAGRRFALQEGTLLLAVLLRKLKFRLKPEYKMKPSIQGIIMEPSEELPLIISRRN